MKIAGKQVWLAYCYATELAFYDMTDTDINDFFKEFFLTQTKKRMRKRRRRNRKLKLILYAIFAAAFSYSRVKKDCEI